MNRPRADASLSITRQKSAAKRSKSTKLIVACDDAQLLERTELWLSLLSDQLAVADERQVEALIAAAVPNIAPLPSSAVMRQAQRNARARTAFLEDNAALSAEDVHTLAGSRAHNRYALATRWRQEGRIFGLQHAGKTYYPAFQFDADGQPRASIARVIEHLGEDPDGWQTALWFTLANGWLGGRTPLDLLDDDPDALVDAARQEAADVG